MGEQRYNTHHYDAEWIKERIKEAKHTMVMQVPVGIGKTGGGKPTRNRKHLLIG